MKQALVLGCSHAAGSEMEKQPGIVIDQNNLYQFGYLHSYPVQLANLLGYSALNHAIAGGSNDAMFRIFEDFVSAGKSSNIPAIVIACWTGDTRSEIWHPIENRWQGIAPGKEKFYQMTDNDIIREGQNIPLPVHNETEYLDYQKHWVLHHSEGGWGRYNKIKNVVALNALAKIHDIAVINIDSFCPLRDYNFGPDIYYPVLPQDFCGWAEQRNYSDTDWGHFFIDAHKDFAEFVYSKIPASYRA